MVWLRSEEVHIRGVRSRRKGCALSTRTSIKALPAPDGIGEPGRAAVLASRSWHRDGATLVPSRALRAREQRRDDPLAWYAEVAVNLSRWTSTGGTCGGNPSAGYALGPSSDRRGCARLRGRHTSSSARCARNVRDGGFRCSSGQGGDDYGSMARRCQLAYWKPDGPDTSGVATFVRTSPETESMIARPSAPST